MTKHGSSQRGRRKASESGFLGVSEDVNRKRWKARFCHNGKEHFLGRFETAKEAALRYDQAMDVINSHTDRAQPRAKNFPDTVTADAAVEEHVLTLIASSGITTSPAAASPEVEQNTALGSTSEEQQPPRSPSLDPFIQYPAGATDLVGSGEASNGNSGSGRAWQGYQDVYTAALLLADTHSQQQQGQEQLRFQQQHMHLATPAGGAAHMPGLLHFGGAASHNHLQTPPAAAYGAGMVPYGVLSAEHNPLLHSASANAQYSYSARSSDAMYGMHQGPTPAAAAGGGWARMQGAPDLARLAGLHPPYLSAHPPLAAAAAAAYQSAADGAQQLQLQAEHGLFNTFGPRFSTEMGFGSITAAECDGLMALLADPAPINGAVLPQQQQYIGLGAAAGTGHVPSAGIGAGVGVVAGAVAVAVAGVGAGVSTAYSAGPGCGLSLVGLSFWRDGLAFASTCAEGVLELKALARFTCLPDNLICTSSSSGSSYGSPSIGLGSSDGSRGSSGASGGRVFCGVLSDWAVRVKGELHAQVASGALGCAVALPVRVLMQQLAIALTEAVAAADSVETARGVVLSVCGVIVGAMLNLHRQLADAQGASGDMGAVMQQWAVGLSMGMGSSPAAAIVAQVAAVM